MPSTVSRRTLIGGAALGALAAAAPARALAQEPIPAGNPPVTLDPALADGTTDRSAYIQAAIDDLHARGGGEIVVPAGVYLCNVVIKPNVSLRGTGWKSILRANPGSTTPVIGSVKTGTRNDPLDPYHCAIVRLRIDGNASSGATGHGIELVSSAADTYWSIAGHIAPDKWNDPAPLVEGVFVNDTGGDGIVLGRNMRGAWVRGTFVRAARRRGIVIAGTDMQLSDVQVGACGDGILFTQHGCNNLLSNCKFWWCTGTRKAGFFGNGNGVQLERGSRNQFTGCQTQDNFGAGVAIQSATSNVFTGHLCGGEGYAAFALYSGLAPCEWNQIDLQSVWADRTQMTRLVRLDGANVRDNQFRLADNPAVSRLAGFVPVVYANGAGRARNRVTGPLFETWQKPALAAGWVSAGSPYCAVQFRKDGDTVCLRGAVKGGQPGAALFTLPEHYRPDATELVAACGLDATVVPVRVDPAGTVTPLAAPADGISLDVTFAV